MREKQSVFAIDYVFDISELDSDNLSKYETDHYKSTKYKELNEVSCLCLFT